MSWSKGNPNSEIIQKSCFLKSADGLIFVDQQFIPKENPSLKSLITEHTFGKDDIKRGIMLGSTEPIQLIFLTELQDGYTRQTKKRILSPVRFEQRENSYRPFTLIPVYIPLLGDFFRLRVSGQAVNKINEYAEEFENQVIKKNPSLPQEMYAYRHFLEFSEVFKTSKGACIKAPKHQFFKPEEHFIGEESLEGIQVLYKEFALPYLIKQEDLRISDWKKYQQKEQAA